MGSSESASGIPSKLRWKIASASVVGTSHIRSGLPCQDSTQFRYLPIPDAPPDTLIAAVADGAGSAPYSDQGSRLAAGSSIDSIASSLANRTAGVDVDVDTLLGMLAESIQAAHQAINDLAQANEHRPREYASTLLVAVCANGLLGAAQIGDGAVVAAGDDGEYVLVTSPDRGEYANETSFITETRSADLIRRSACCPTSGRGPSPCSPTAFRTWCWTIATAPSQYPTRPSFAAFSAGWNSSPTSCPHTSACGDS